MIISHKYKFIFLKTSKTAGTSIEIALSKFCGEDDIITPIYPEEEMRRQLGYRGAQNYEAGFYNHMPAHKAVKLIDSHIWNSYYKFCFERNPWDRFISHYYWMCKSEPRPSIAEFLEESDPLAALKSTGFTLYTIDGEIAVDKVCFYENLAQELEQLRLKLGLSEKIQLPKAKTSHRKDRRSYREILNETQRKKIEDAFSKEIDLFGYRF